MIELLLPVGWLVYYWQQPLARWGLLSFGVACPTLVIH